MDPPTPSRHLHRVPTTASAEGYGFSTSPWPSPGCANCQATVILIVPAFLKSHGKEEQGLTDQHGFSRAHRHHPAFRLASIPAPSRLHPGVRGPQPGVGGPEPYEGRGTSWPSGAAPAPRSQQSRSQQPWGRSYPTRLPAPAAFPTSSEQLRLFLPSPSQESFLRGHLHHFGVFAQGIVTPFQRKEGEKQPKPEPSQSCYETPFPGGSSPAGPTMNLSGIPVKSPDRDLMHFRIWTQ